MRKRHFSLCLIVFILIPSVLLRAQAETPAGRIAYIGMDYNVYVEDFAQDNTIALTDDADPENFYIYEMPTWATDGRLAYFSRAREGRNLQLGAYVARDGDATGTLVFEATNRVLNYAYWSPADCSEGEHCRDLALLLSGTEDLTVELVRDSDDGVSYTTIGSGGPFYYSWSPEGTQMLWQRDTEQLNVYDVASDEISETLDVVPGIFQAPAWSPVDDRLLFGVLNGENTDLTVFEDSETSVLAPELDGIVAFAWSPDARYIAYTEGYRSLAVLEVATGEVVTQTLEEGVFAFFWSPNSEALAYTTLASQQNSSSAKLRQEPNGIAWSVIDVRDGEERHFGAFFPTNDMLYLLTYFDQFAQSHRVWSPDSRYLVYGEFSADGAPLVRMLDTTETNAEAETIAEGMIGIWSFE